MGRKNSNARPRQKARKIRMVSCRRHSNTSIGYSNTSIEHTANMRHGDVQQKEDAVGKGELPAPHRFEVWFASLGSHYTTSIQSGTRPVLVISNDVANRYSRTVTVIPMTSKRKKLELPTHVVLSASDCKHYGTQRLSDSVLLAEQIVTIDKTMLLDRLCVVESKRKKQEIGCAVTTHLGMDKALQPESAEA